MSTVDGSGTARSAPHATLPGNVVTSVAAAQQALDHLEVSLRSAGFAEGAAAYERMAEILLSQYLLHASDTPAVAAEFVTLGATARRVFGLLHPYATVMRQLATLAPEGPEEGTGRGKVLAELQRRGRRGGSAQLLASATGLPRAAVDSALQELLDAGAVTVRGHVGSRLFVLGDRRAESADQRPSQHRRRSRDDRR